MSQVNEKEGLGVWNLVRRNEVYLESGYGGSSKRRVRLFGLQSLEVTMGFPIMGGISYL